MTYVIQATHFSLSGQMIPTVPTDGAKYRARKVWPFYTATIFNEDGSELDTRSGWNDYELTRWIESFGIVIPRFEEPFWTHNNLMDER